MVYLLINSVGSPIFYLLLLCSNIENCFCNFRDHASQLDSYEYSILHKSQSPTDCSVAVRQDI